MRRRLSLWSRPFNPRLERLEAREVPAVITVTTSLDDNISGNGLLSLREAARAADTNNAGPADPDVAANSVGTFGDDTIVFAASVVDPINLDNTISFGSAEGLTIDGGGDVVVVGPTGQPLPAFAPSGGGAVGNVLRGLTIQGGDVSGAFSNSGTLLLDGVTVQNTVDNFSIGPLTVRNSRFVNNRGSDTRGGAITNAFSLVVEDSQFVNNQATASSSGVPFGGAIYSRDPGVTLSIARSVFENNVAQGPLSGGVGGAVAHFGGSLTVTDSVFRSNRAVGAGDLGGAIAVSSSAAVLVSGSTFDGNSADDGGAVHIDATQGGPYTLTNNTFVGNSAGNSGEPGFGAAVSAFSDGGAGTGTVTATNNTVVRNLLSDTGGQGGGFYTAGVPFVLRNNIVSQNAASAPTTTGPDLAGTFTSTGGNLVGTAAGSTGLGGLDVIDPADPVAALAGNGGLQVGPDKTAVQTAAPLAGSRALGLGQAGGTTPGTDQRGRPRPSDGQTDAGALQAQRPTAADDSFNLPFGGGAVGAPGVLAGDARTDVFGPLTAVLVAPPGAGGTLTLDPSGAFTYTPPSGFSGVTTFTYQAFDGVSRSAVRTVSVSVAAPAPPTAADDGPFAFPFNGGTVATPGVLDNDSPGDGSTLEAVLVSQPPPGSATVVLNPDGSFTVTPESGFTGLASFVYKAFDGLAFSPNATVTFSITAVPPTAVGDTFTTPPGQTLTVPAPGILANDKLGDGPSLTAVLFSPLAPSSAGTLSPSADGGFVFTPAPGFTGKAGFSYSVSDGLTTSPAAANVFISVLAPPTAVDDSYAVPADGQLTIPFPGVLANDTRNGGSGGLTAVPFGEGVPGSSGTLTFNADGSFSFVPAAGVSGPVTFQYQAQDGAGLSNVATVTLNVGAAPALVAPDRSYGPVTAGTTLTVPAADGLLSGLSHTGRPLRVINAAPTVGSGTLEVAADGGFRFTPPANEPTGSVTFTYQLTDGVGQPSNIATVTVSVTGVPLTAVQRFTAFGTGAGVRAQVRVVRPGQPDLNLRPFEDSFLGGARVAVADVNLDGVDDIVVGAGPGGGPRVTVYDGTTGAQLANFFAFEESFRGGAHVGAADAVTSANARTSLLVVGAGSFAAQPGTPRVRAFRDFTGLPGEGSQGFAPVDFIAYDPRFQGGVRVAAGDLDGDGAIEVVTIPGPSGGADLRVYDTARQSGTTPALRQQIGGLGGETASYRGGAFVAVASGAIVVTPDSLADLTGTELSAQAGGLVDTLGGTGGLVGISALTTQRSPVVNVFLPTGRGLVTPSPLQFDLGDPTFLGGARVAAGLTASGPAVLVGYGAGGRGRVRQFAFNPAGGVSSAAQVLDRTRETALFPLGDLGTDTSVYVAAAALPFHGAAVGV